MCFIAWRLHPSTRRLHIFLKPKTNFTAALKVANLSQIEHIQGTQFERDSFFLYIFSTHPLNQ